jgi:hypothetical protein
MVMMGLEEPDVSIFRIEDGGGGILDHKVGGMASHPRTPVSMDEITVAFHLYLYE